MWNSSIPIMGALRTILGVFPESRPSDFSPHWHCQDFREIGRFWCCCGWICLSRWVGFTGWNHIARDWSTPNISWRLKKIRTKIIDSPSGEKDTITLSFQIQRLGFEKVVENSRASLWDQNNIHQVRFYRTRQNKWWKRPFPWWKSSLYWLVNFRNLQSCLESPYIKNKPTKGNPTDPQLVDLILTLWSEYAQKFHPSLKKHYIFIPIPRHRNNSEGIWTQKFQYLKHPEVFECLGYVVTYTFQVCKTYLEWKQQKGSSLWTSETRFYGVFVTISSKIRQLNQANK